MACCLTHPQCAASDAAPTTAAIAATDRSEGKAAMPTAASTAPIATAADSVTIKAADTAVVAIATTAVDKARPHQSQHGLLQ